MIETFVASGSEVYEVVKSIEPSLENVNRKLAIVSCLSIVLTLSNPDLSPEDLQEGIKEVSQFICLWMSGKGTTEADGYREVVQ